MQGRRFIYYDTETTGIKPGKDRIVEIAAYDPLQERTFCQFSNPECLIPQEASAITGITDVMVQDAPKIRETLLAFQAFCPPDEIVLVAHNNDAFDQLFLEAEFKRADLPFPNWVFLDSLKWSRKYRNDLPRHSLQSLREVFGIAENQAHRALDDVLVLHQIFSRMIDDLPLEKVCTLIQEKPAIFRMPFGKHVGKPLSALPRDYIVWLKESGALDKKENIALREALEGIS